MNKLRRLTAFLLAVLLLFALCGCESFDYLRMEALELTLNEASVTSYYAEPEDFRENMVSFADMEYVRPELSELEVKAYAVRHLINARRADVDELYTALNDFFRAYDSYNGMRILAGLRSDLDTSDEYYFEEHSFCEEMYAEASSIYEELMLDCAYSKYYLYLDRYYFCGGLSSGDRSEAVYDSEMIELSEKQAELLSQYEALSAEMALFSFDEACERYYDEAAEIYIDLIKVRRAIAEKLGFEDYAHYRYDFYERSYTPEDAEKFVKSVKKYILPIYRAASEDGRVYRSLQSTAYISSEQALYEAAEVVKAMNSTFGCALQFMRDYGLFAVSDSSSMRRGSYVTYLGNYDAPFLRCSTSGAEEDVLSVLHELGHYVEYYVNYGGTNDLDSAEFFSQGMEYLALRYLSAGGMKERLTEYKLSDELCLYIDQSCYTEFETRAYELPDDELTPDRLYELFSELCGQYYYVDSMGYDMGSSWIDVSHLYEYPFYVISYCVSDGAALELYSMEYGQTGRGIRTYQRMMDSALDCGFIELLENNGIESPLTEEGVKSIADILSEKLAEAA